MLADLLKNPFGSASSHLALQLLNILLADFGQLLQKWNTNREIMCDFEDLSTLGVDPGVRGIGACDNRY